MAKVIILGSAYSIPDATHENAHFALLGKYSGVLVDCGANPTVRLQQAGVDYDTITDVILTHFHPDHVSGAPLMLMNMWLLGRQKPLQVRGLAHCMDRLQKLMELYDWGKWPNLFHIDLHGVPEAENVLILDNADFHITASPGEHFVPTIGLQIKSKANGRVLTYSCDTAVCPTISRLAAGTDILIHEAAGASEGHSSPAQAGELATSVGAKILYLIHYDVHHLDADGLQAAARETFDGEVHLAQDFLSFDF